MGIKYKNIPHEYKDLELNLRNDDIRKLLVGYINILLQNHQEAMSKSLIVAIDKIGQGAEGSADAISQIETFLEYLDEFRTGLLQIRDKVEEHLYVDSNIVGKLSIPQGEPISGDEFSKRIKQAQVEDKEKKKEIKKRIEKKKKKKAAKK